MPPECTASLQKERCNIINCSGSDGLRSTKFLLAAGTLRAQYLRRDASSRIELSQQVELGSNITKGICAWQSLEAYLLEGGLIEIELTAYNLVFACESLQARFENEALHAGEKRSSISIGLMPEYGQPVLLSACLGRAKPMSDSSARDRRQKRLG